MVTDLDASLSNCLTPFTYVDEKTVSLKPISTESCTKELWYAPIFNGSNDIFPTRDVFRGGVGEISITRMESKAIHDSAKADTIVKTLTRLGCEVKKSQHGGHVDVRYRCPKWRQLRCDSHSEAHRWEKWLKEFSFQTVHQH